MYLRVARFSLFSNLSDSSASAVVWNKNKTPQPTTTKPPHQNNKTKQTNPKQQQQNNSQTNKKPQQQYKTQTKPKSKNQSKKKKKDLPRGWHNKNGEKMF